MLIPVRFTLEYTLHIFKTSHAAAEQPPELVQYHWCVWGFMGTQDRALLRIAYSLRISKKKQRRRGVGSGKDKWKEFAVFGTGQYQRGKCISKNLHFEVGFEGGDRGGILYMLGEEVPGTMGSQEEERLESLKEKETFRRQREVTVLGKDGGRR